MNDPVQVNLCQKLLILHLLTHNMTAMTTTCSLNYKFNTYMKIPSSNLGRTCCAQKLFLTFRTIFVHNMFSPCSAKRRASDKDLHMYLQICSSNFVIFRKVALISLKCSVRLFRLVLSYFVVFEKECEFLPFWFQDAKVTRKQDCQFHVLRSTS